MKVEQRLGNVTIVGEGESQQEVWAQLASLSEIFGDEPCGQCNGTNIRLRVRHVEKEDGKKKKEYDFYEKVCMNHKCRARLAFGERQDKSGLFPKRKDENGQYIGKYGWSCYQSNNKSNTNQNHGSSEENNIPF